MPEGGVSRSSRMFTVFALLCCSWSTAAVAQEPEPAAPTLRRQVFDHIASRLGDMVRIEGPLTDAEPSGAPTSERRGIVSAGLRQATSQAGPADMLEVVVGIEPVSMNPNMDGFRRETILEIREGRLANTWINSKLVTAEEVDQLIEEKRRRLSADAALRRDYYSSVWRELSRTTSDPKLASKLVSASETRRLAVTTEQLAELERIGSPWLDSIDLADQGEDVDGLTDAMAALGLTAGVTPHDGFGVGTWIQDGQGRPATTHTQIDENRLYTEDYGTEDIEDHATFMTAVLMQTAAGSSVHWAVAPLPCRIRNDVDEFAPEVYVSSTSSSPFGDTGNDYSTCSGLWDQFVLENQIAHFAFSGSAKAGYSIQGSGKARNVIAVGATDDSDPPQWVPLISPYIDPANGVLKPELVAPGVNVTVHGMPPLGGAVNLQGTSPAAQLAAGLGAVLLEAYPAMKYQPQLLKILLMTSATDTDGVSGVLGFSGNDGAGIPGYGAAINFNALLASVEGPNSEGGVKDFTVSLSASKTYRIGIAYLASGTYANAHNGDINVDYNMTIFPPPGNTITSVVSTGQTFRMLVYEPRVTGTYTIRAERVSNLDNTDYHLGFSVVEVP